MLEHVKTAVDKVSQAFEFLRDIVNKVFAVFLAVILPVRIAFNALQIAVDTTIVFIWRLGKNVRVAMTAIVNVVMNAVEVFKALGETLGMLFFRVSEAVRALWEKDFGKLKDIGGAFIGDMKAAWDSLSEKVAKNNGVIVSEWNAGVTEMGAVTDELKKRTDKNAQDMAEAITGIGAAWNKASVKMRGDLGGSGSLGGGGGDADAHVAARLKWEIELLQKRLEANKMYSDLIIENVRNEYDRKRIEINFAESEMLDQAQRWLDEGVISYQRHEEMKVEIARRAAQQRVDIAKAEANAKVDTAFNLTNALLNLAKAATQSSKAEAQKQQRILLAIAIADAAAAGVKGLYDVFQESGSVAEKVIKAIAVVAEVGAIAAVEISSIANASFARGTSFAGGGVSLVGEEGPELVNMPRGAQVLTAPQTRQYIGGTTISPTIIIQGNASDATVHAMGAELERFAQTMQEAKRRGYLDAAVA